MNSIETFKNHNVLVTGGTGMIGRPLVRKLLNEGAILTIASIDKPNIDDELLKHAKFIYADLRNLEDCKKVVSGNEIVFHLAGIKGSPKLTQSQPATFFTNTMMFNLNMMEAARSAGVPKLPILFEFKSLPVSSPSQSRFDTAELEVDLSL